MAGLSRGFLLKSVEIRIHPEGAQWVRLSGSLPRRVRLGVFCNCVCILGF